MNAKQSVIQLLAGAGVTVGGTAPGDIVVHDERWYGRVLAGGLLALGESYMDGWWDAESLDVFFHRVITGGLEDRARANWRLALSLIINKLFNMQTRARSMKAVHDHYDLSSKLYESFLDPYNQYTCGYFKNTDDLNVAQEQKLDLICKKLKLSASDRVLDIGCGWGGFAKYATERHGCHVTGITISNEQATYAREYTNGLPVEIKIMDYRDISDMYDKVLVCGMIEHVGYKNYRTIMEIAHTHLTDDGLFLLHTIGGNSSITNPDPWIDKYIFPNSMLPSIKQLGDAIEGLFVMEDWHNFGAYYDKTLLAWHTNFVTNWNKIKNNYNERFYRMWRYYLLSCAGSFRARNVQLWQIVLSKSGIPGGYVSIR